jgi:hypothetical protein
LEQSSHFLKIKKEQYIMSLFPPQLATIVGITAWQTYRLIGLSLLPMLGTVLPKPWLLPMINTGIIGLTAPLIAYRLATSNSMFAWAVAVAWTWWGLVDFTHYLATEYCFPMSKELPYVFGEHTPRWLTQVWLGGNMAIEAYMFSLLWSPEVISYFSGIEGSSTSLALGDTVMGGKWLGIIAFGILFQPGFPLVGKSLSAVFYALGFRAKTTTMKKN